MAWSVGGLIQNPALPARTGLYEGCNFPFAALTDSLYSKTAGRSFALIPRRLRLRGALGPVFFNPQPRTGRDPPAPRYSA